MEKQEKLKTINIDGTRYRTTIPDTYLNRKRYLKPDNTKITAYIPGTIYKVFVKEGQKVKKGSRLATLEVMKMRSRILCPFNAIIKSIKVKPGQVVCKNELIIILEEDNKV